MFLAIASLSLLCCAPARAVVDIPQAPVQDAVMASAAESAALLDWAERVFGNPSGVGYGLELTLRRQDHSVLRVNRSCIETPLRIGGRAFEHGLGTHSNSEIAVRLPDGAQRFRAFCGVDNNDDTGGKRGSVVCSV
ncbi:MAG TPA: NPCBM/NEW2 domain-containing protein, partial [Candidatus Hydrogenedentes bacterium]|nr:NPCBM/NEW2 domain-containing protein [Candidatus Hydrogenedentota bacterium]